MTAALRQITELGVERYCRKCGEFWPDDVEFWVIQTRRAGSQNSSHGRTYTVRTACRVYACRACRRDNQAAYQRARRAAL